MNLAPLKSNMDSFANNIKQQLNILVKHGMKTIFTGKAQKWLLLYNWLHVSERKMSEKCLADVVKQRARPQQLSIATLTYFSWEPVPTILRSF